MPSPVHEFDIVIIGSGAGGGTVAAELAPLCAQGVRIAVLELGPRFRPEDLRGTELEMADKLYFDGGGSFTRDRAMTLAFGRGYGGSTVVYTGTSLKAPARVVADWGLDGLTPADVHARSDKYMAQNNVHLLPEDLINENNRLFRDGCRTLGYRTEQFPVNVKDCRGSGHCNLGCEFGAKQGTHRVQLPAAEQQGVQMVTNCRVDRIGDRVCEVTVRSPGYGEPSLWPDGRYQVRAKVVVVAAGAVNTPALLLRSRLPVDLPALGRYFTCHPALILVGQHGRPIVNCLGHPKSYCCDQFADKEGFLLETCMYFPFVTAKSLAGFGAEHRQLMERMDHVQMILALAFDHAEPSNRVTVDRQGDPVVDYRLSPAVLGSLRSAMVNAARIFFAAGARRVHAPAASKFFLEPADEPHLDELISPAGMKLGKVPITAAHPMGGCRMGTDRATSVTDSWGRVHGIPWLYVADSSLFPSSAEANPYLTVMALADRVAEGIRNRIPDLLAASPSA